MENKSHALLAGMFTLALLVAAILLGLWFNRDRVERIPYEMVTKLSIPGLNPQAAVRYRGLDVGRVDEITFDPKVPGQILVHLSVRADTPITKSTYGTLGYQGVTGIAYVQLDDDGTNPVKVSSSRNQVARIDMRPSLLDNLQSRGLVILEEAEQLTRRFNILLNDDNQKTMLAAFDNVSKAAIEIEAIPKKLEPTLSTLPALSRQAQQTLASMTTLSKNATMLSNNLDTFVSSLQTPTGLVATLSAATEQIGIVANKVEYEVLPLTHDVRSSMRALNRTMNNLGENPQSILFGSPHITPGPGEPGFIVPAK
jgi:phospholipid/cholesterol/gamma-HCH transport system substrate-binding protein